MIFSLCGMLLFVLLVPKYQEIMFARDTVEEREIVYQKMLIARANIQRLAEEEARRGAEIQRLSIALPNEQKPEELIVALEELARQSRIRIESITINEGTVQQAKRFSELSFSMNINGTYSDILSFLRGLETNLRLIDVESLNIAGSSEIDDRMSVSIKAKTYHLVSEQKTQHEE